jgi:hypothetical protein
MSEANLWDNIRNNLGHRGHFSRIEFNPTEGHPDVSYCIKGIEGHMELKFIPRAPARMTTAVFTDHHGLRDSQKAWIHTRVKHKGRVAIVAQVGEIIFVVPGFEWRRFNQMTYFDLGKACIWGDRPGWASLYGALIEPQTRYLGQAL